jgi:hypothetical protein
MGAFPDSRTFAKLRGLEYIVPMEKSEQPKNIEYRILLRRTSVEGWNRFAHSFFKTDRIHYSMFDVGRSTCPQCLDGGVSRIQPFDLYIDVNTNQMHYAWQAGVRCSLVFFRLN